MKIVIGGCGKLGSEIGTALLQEGHDVYGTYRSSEGKDRLKVLGINPIEYTFSATFSQISTEITENTDLLVISLPPIHKDDPLAYSIALSNFMALFEDTTKVIFTSSIGVYPKLEGNFDESYVFSAKDALNSIFLAEKAILAIARDKSVVLRLGGLISKQRHPIRYLAGKSVPEDGTAPVNLVHHQDVVRFVLLAIQNFQPGIYNLVANINLNKQEYYTEAAQHFGLPYPVFGQLPDINRCVSGELVKLKFGFTYSYSPLDWNSFTK